MNLQQAISEMDFKAVRSSGAGGQHVNKVSSKIILNFNIETSQAINEEEREILLSKLSSRLTSSNVLIITSEETRSQHKNKELAIKKFQNILEQSLTLPKKRIKKRVSKASKLKRLREKKIKSEIKSNRQKPNLQ